MLRKELNILERAYEAEIRSAFSEDLPHLLQTKSKTAKKLVEDGFLDFTTILIGNVQVSGYVLTDLGRLAYCTEC